MKTFTKQLLTLGGFYSLTSFLLSLIVTFIIVLWALAGSYSIPSILSSSTSNFITIVLNSIMFVAFVIFVLILCIKKRFSFIEKFSKKFPKINNYVMGLGIMKYYSIASGCVISVLGYIYGFKATQAQFSSASYDSMIPVFFFGLVFVYYLLFVVVMIGATYVSFFKKKTH